MTMKSGKNSGRGKMSNNSTEIHVTVTPELPNGKTVAIAAVGTQPYVQSNGDITGLEAGESYDIKFTLAGANGVNSWNTGNPFNNQAGSSCPLPEQGATAPFGVKSGTSSSLATIHLDGQSSSSGTTTYRLNFNDSYNCDPIIVVN
jgi:hypothetical protein